MLFPEFVRRAIKRGMEESVLPELTAASVVVGIVLAIVFGASNAYLGLRVGMTVSASILAAAVFWYGRGRKSE